MKLKTLFDKCDTLKVVDRLLELYPNQDKAKDAYIELIGKLKNMVVPEDVLKENHLTVYITHVWDCFSEDESELEEYEDVSGYDYDEGISYSCEFCSFAEWLAMDVSEPSLNHYGEVDFLAHVCWEMTFVSFDEGDITDAKLDIKRMSEEVKEALESGDDSMFVSSHVFSSEDLVISDKEREIIDKYQQMTDEFAKKMLGCSKKNIDKILKDS